MRIIQILASIGIATTLSSCTYEKSPPVCPPPSPSAISNARAGLNYLHSGYTDKARERLKLALNQAPNNPMIIDAMAYYYEKTGEIIKANDYYRKAIIANPNSGTALNNYGAFLCRNGRYEASLSYFDDATDLLGPKMARNARANKIFCMRKMEASLGSRSASAYYMQQ
jgi:type IV pilus assembly protein PilF